MVGEFEFDERAVLDPIVPWFPGHAVGMLPMRIRLCGVDLLSPNWDKRRIGEPGWAEFSLIDLATYGLVCFRLVRWYGRSSFPLDESSDALLFKLVGERVLVCSTLTNVVVDVPYAELDRDWSAFAFRAKQRVVDEFPALSDNPIWQWLDPRNAIGDPGWENLFAAEYRFNDFDDRPITKSCG